MTKAGDRIEAAANIQSTGQGDLADVSFLSYEAMFCCLRALVYAKGYREAGLRCLMLACEHLYIRPGLLDVEHIHAFERAQGAEDAPRSEPRRGLGVRPADARTAGAVTPARRRSLPRALPDAIR